VRSSARHTAAVIALALAGLVVAVALGVIVSRTASQSVALGGADLGAGSHLVVTTTVTRRSAPGPRTTASPAPPRTTSDDDAAGSERSDAGGSDDD
jgi:hypothetical protein